jgi:hypothetical protein
MPKDFPKVQRTVTLCLFQCPAPLEILLKTVSTNILRLPIKVGTSSAAFGRKPFSNYRVNLNKILQKTAKILRG